ncbi:MAG: DUF1569 domain-containing protein [Planctomycetota bacterium]
MIDTKTADRRELRYTSLDDLASDIEAIDASWQAGTLKTTGNWSAGQITEHVAILMECAVDGFPGKPAPWLVRKVIKMLFLKKALTGDPLPPGFKIPSQASFLTPGDNTTTEAGVAQLRTIVDRVRGGVRFTHPSPIFEKLTHEQWVMLQLGHASMHMSFIQPSET